MFGNLKTQLLLATSVALIMLSMGIWAVSHRLAGWGIAMFVVLAVFLIAVENFYKIYLGKFVGNCGELCNFVS